ncbi:Tat pathway signal protein [Streptomyces sp. NPDC007875]|uniref:Tat pathway signal protein n=1 Tax=Streptomyces sp. NPDC007875 TaxID=3364783 RepID=UPI003679E733
MGVRPNERLANALQRAGISNRDLARRVNVRAAAAGLNIAVDCARVGRWLKGEHPRDPVPGIVAEVLSQKLGPLTLADLGWSHTGIDPLDPLWSPDGAAHSLHEYARSDLMLSRRDMAQLAVGLPLIAAAERLWWADPPAGTTAPGPAARVGKEDVAGIEQLVRHFRDLDGRHGGALFRAAIVAQLQDVTELLAHGRTSTPAVDRRLRQTAVDLAQLAGWTAHDAGYYGTAQRYWTHAITLARQAQDPGRGAEVMSRLAHQMVYLGRPDDALQLLDVAGRTAAAAHNLRLTAMLTAQRGRMLAAVGDAQASLATLAQAQEHLARAEENGERVEEWIAYFTAAELAGATAVAYRDLHTLHGKPVGKASVHFATAIEQRGAGYERVRAMDMVGMAAAHLEEDNLEEACAVAGQALDLAERLDSTLIRSRVLTLATATDRVSSHPQVVELHQRLGGWAAPDLHAA